MKDFIGISLMAIGFAFIFLGISETAKASEVFGRISTNPNSLVQSIESQSVSEAPQNGSATVKPIFVDTVGEAVPYLNQPKESNNYKDDLSGINESVSNNKAVKESGEILGIKIYADGVLLRDSKKRIFVIRNQAKKHIRDIQELKKYSGRPIKDVSDEELFKIKYAKYVNGALIREIGDIKVYEVKNEKKYHHVLDLEELRLNFFGLEIYNISREEMREY